MMGIPLLPSAGVTTWLAGSGTTHEADLNRGTAVWVRTQRTVHFMVLISVVPLGLGFTIPYAPAPG
jgi:hypothetical protein